MTFKTISWLGAGLIGLSLALPAQAQEQGQDQTLAEEAQGEHHGHSHDHQHGGESEEAKAAKEAIYKGYFDDAQIAPRALSDWQGDWQSVYPLLQKGVLDPVMEAKAKSGDKTAAEYLEYYKTGYATDIDRIEIRGGSVRFFGPSGQVHGNYSSDGYEILNYEKGNRGVRFIFRKTGGDAEAPQFIQFSDHAIAPQKAGHFHLYWGDDRAEVLKELTNWPTYYPASLNADEVVAEMLAH